MRFRNLIKLTLNGVFRSHPNIKPLLIRSITFPFQFITSLVLWKIIYENASDKMIQSLLMMSSVLFISTILLFGGHTNLTNMVIDRSPKSKEQFGLTLLMPLFVLVISLPAIFVFSEKLNSFFLLEPGGENVLVFLACMLSLIAPSAAFQSILVGTGKNSFIAIIPFFGSIFALLVAVLIVEFKMITNITLLLILISSSLFSSLVIGVRAFKLISLSRIKIEKSSVCSYFNLGSFLISIGAPLAFQLDRILVVRWGTVGDALESAPVNRMVASVTLILSSAALSFWPDLNRRKNNDLIRKYMLNSFAVALIFSMSILLIGPYLVKYVSSAEVVFSVRSQLSVGFFVLSYSLTIVPILVLTSRTGQLKVFLSMTLNAIFTMAMSFYLIPKIGLAGYYFSSGMCTLIFMCIPLYFISLKELPSKKTDKHNKT